MPGLAGRELPPLLSPGRPLDDLLLLLLWDLYFLSDEVVPRELVYCTHLLAVLLV